MDLGQIIAHTQRELPPKLTWFWDRTYPELEISNTKKTYPRAFLDPRQDLPRSIQGLPRDFLVQETPLRHT